MELKKKPCSVDRANPAESPLARWLLGRIQAGRNPTNRERQIPPLRLKLCWSLCRPSRHEPRWKLTNRQWLVYFFNGDLLEAFLLILTH